MVSGQAAHFESLRRMVTETGWECELRRADDLPLALARVAGGGVKLVLLDLSDWRNNPARLDSVLRLPCAAPGLPFAIWSDGDDASLPAIATQTGAVGCVTNGNSLPELTRILSLVFGDRKPSAAEAAGIPETRAAAATLIAVMGLKGGIGASTVAMNVAAALAAGDKVVLAEMRPVFGSLQSHFHTGRMVRGFSNRRTTDIAGAAKSVLWPAPTVAGLRVLFGPQTPEDCGEMDARQARGWLQALAAEADFVVLDLPFSLSLANVGMIGASHHLVLVIEPTAACLRLARLTLESIRNWDEAPPAIGTVVVRRTSDGAPVPLPEIEAELGVPVLKTIPPAAEQCLRAERTHVPVIQCDPDSLVADSFHRLARHFKPLN